MCLLVCLAAVLGLRLGRWLRRRRLGCADGVPWSTDHVLETSLIIAQKNQLGVTLLEVLNDLDSPQDLEKSCINLCDRLASQISGRARAGGGTMARLIRFNYGAVDPSLLPRLRHENLDSDELAESMGQLAPLVQSGLLTPTDEIERSIRARIGAGDLPEEAQRSAFERAASGGPSAAALAERLIQRR